MFLCLTKLSSLAVEKITPGTSGENSREIMTFRFKEVPTSFKRLRFERVKAKCGSLFVGRGWA